MEDVKHAGSTKLVRSIVLTEKGSFEHVKVIEWPLPTKCKSREVRVAVEFCGVNFADVYHVQGQLVQCLPPYVLGLECAGKITEVGSEVEDLLVGERVVCYKPNSGMFSETVVVPRNNCFPIPRDICSKVACALLVNYLTAYIALFELGHLRVGQTLLVHSAAGGVGWAATQLANNISNVKICGTASANKHEAISKNGVQLPLTYENYVSQLVGPDNHVDVIIDNIGGDNVKTSIDLLKPLGRVVLTGANCAVQEDEGKAAEVLQSLATCALSLRELVMGNKVVCGLHLGTLLESKPHTVFRAVQEIFTLCQQGLIEPRVHTVYPFHKGSEAIKALAERKNIGKILLKVE